MKRILFFLWLLVNLQLTTYNGSLSIGFGEVSAQRLMESSLKKTTTRGWGDWDTVYRCDCEDVFYDPVTYSDHITYDCMYEVRCNACGDYPIWRCNLWEHQQYDCPFRDVFCSVCDRRTTAYAIETGEHICNMPCYCVWCGTRLENGEACFCYGAIIHGQKKVSEEDWNLYYRDDRDDDFSGGFVGQPSGTPRKTISIKNLKSMSGVTLLPKLPDKLHPQRLKMECSIRAFAFIRELQGFDYQTEFDTLFYRATKVEGFNLKDDGIPPSKFQKILKEIVEIDTSKDTTWDVITDYIKRGVPVAVCTNKVPGHVVTIIGYDNDGNYYTASGAENGEASVYKWQELNRSEIYIINK